MAVAFVPHLRRQHQTISARFQVPKDVRDHPFFGGKSELYRTLRTRDEQLAEVYKAQFIAECKAKVMEARGRAGAVEANALWWRKQIETASSETEAKTDQLDALEEYVAETYGVRNHSNMDDLYARSGPRGQHFLNVALAKETPLDPFIETWATWFEKTVERKTADMAKGVVKRFASEFPSAHLVNHKSVSGWIARRIDSGGSPNTVQRDLTHLRAFWKYLRQEEGMVGGEPFNGHKLGKAKARRRKGWLPFAPEDVVRLYRKAVEIKDEPLADLIMLGAYTGARIEEICQLKCSDCAAGVLHIRESKTDAGVREVPIHPKLKPLVKRLVTASTDDFLLSGISSGNQYNDRSNPLGKRFGRLKRDRLGFGDAYVFHSIRKTVTTQLERAGVSENIAADIVGHDKPRITYGLYSGGSSLEQKKAAIRKLKYPGL